MKAEVPVSVLQDKALCREIKRRFPLTNPVVLPLENGIFVSSEFHSVRVYRHGGIRFLYRLGVLVGSFAGPGWKERLFGALKTVLSAGSSR